MRTSSAIQQTTSLAHAGLLRRQLFKSQANKVAKVLITTPSEEAPSGSCISDDMWIWPHTAIPVHLSNRSLNFKRLSPYPRLCFSLKRYLLALLMFPLERFLDVGGLRKRTDYLCKILCYVAASEGDISFKDIEPATLIGAVDKTLVNAPTLRHTVATYLREVCQYGERKSISDYFVRLNNSHFEAIRIGAEGIAPERPMTHQNDDYGVYQPLPDDYVAAAGRIWVFYTRDVLPNFKTIFRETRTLYDDIPRRKTWAGNTGPLSSTTESGIRLRGWVRYLKSYRWLDSNGRLLEKLPFSAKVAFPPRSFEEVFALWGMAQGSLSQLLLLLTGARVSEVETLSRGCIEMFDETQVPANEGSMPLLVGRTSKLSGLKRGIVRDWPVPHHIAEAIELQRSLAEVIAPAGTSLWVSVNKAHFLEGKLTIYHQVTKFALAHELAELLGDGNAHPHRFRKTIARLAVLALTGAPMILRDILGHADISGTILYILSDPEIRREMADMAVEIEQDLVTSISDNLDKAGGKGAAHLRDARRVFFDLIKVPENERQQRRRLDEFVAAKLGDGSSDLRMIYPGIVCIKPKAVVGACGGKDEVDASSCQASCSHYFAMPMQKPVTEQNIEWLLSKLTNPEVVGNPLLSGWYQAQIWEQAQIFCDVAERYAIDPRFQSAMKPFGDASDRR